MSLRKKWLSIILLFSIQWCGAQTISRAEYFFDTDPGPGNGTPLSFTAGDPVTFTENINTTGLEPGYHLLYLRTKTSNGNWSLYEPREFIIDGGIIAAEYYFDADPGVGNGTPLSISPITHTINTSIPTSSLPDGGHYLYVRTRHDDDTWSLSDPVYFYIQVRIVEAEYFIDTDPGLGNGTPITISSPTDLITITPTLSTPALPDGNHYLFIRTKDILGKWSHFEPQLFIVDAALPVALSAFTATPTRDGRVQLRWSTATETNNDFFTVEHTVQDHEFSAVFDVPGAGTTTQLTQYEVFHNNPDPGLNYYRLKQTDFNGMYTYSNIVSADVTKITSVFPNPVSQEWTIEFGSDTNLQQRTVEVMDMAGKTLLTQTTHLNKLLLSRAGIPPGTHILKISSTGSAPEYMKIGFQ